MIVDGIELPQFFPSKWRVQQRCDSLFQEGPLGGGNCVKLSMRGTMGPLLGYEVHLSNYLSLIFSSQSLVTMFRNSQQELKMIIPQY